MVSFFFAPRSELDLGGLFVLAGMVFLSVDTIGLTLQSWNALQKTDISPAVSLLAIGLGMVSQAIVFSSFYYGMAVLVGVLYLVKIFKPKKTASVGTEKPTG